MENHRPLFVNVSGSLNLLVNWVARPEARRTKNKEQRTKNKEQRTCDVPSTFKLCPPNYPTKRGTVPIVAPEMRVGKDSVCRYY